MYLHVFLQYAMRQLLLLVTLKLSSATINYIYKLPFKRSSIFDLETCLFLGLYNVYWPVLIIIGSRGYPHICVHLSSSVAEDIQHIFN